MTAPPDDSNGASPAVLNLASTNVGARPAAARARRDALAATGLGLVALAVWVAFDVDERFAAWVERSVHHKTVEALPVLLAAALALAWYTYRRRNDLAAKVVQLAATEGALREAQARLELTLRAANIAVWSWDPHVGRGSVSPGFYASLGYAPDEITETAGGLQQLIHPDDRPLVVAGFAAYLQHPDGDYEAEVRLRAKDASYRRLLMRAHLVRGGSQGRGVIVGCHVDITKRWQAEQVMAKTQQRFQALVQNAPDGVFLVEGSGRIVDVNAAACSSLGYDRDELVGMYLTDIDPNFDDSDALGLWQRLLEVKSHTLERLHKRTDGSTLPVEIHSTLLEEGSDRLVLSIVRDLTERKRVEAALRDTTEWLRLAIEGSSTGLWEWDLVSGEAHYSASWKQQLGYGDTFEVTWEVWWDALHPDDVERLQAALQKYVENPDGVYEAAIRLRHRDGQYRWMLSRARMLRGADGTPLRMLGAHTDITAQKRAEEEILRLNAHLARRADELEAANRELEAFS